MKHNSLNTEAEMSQVKTGTLYLLNEKRVGRQRLSVTVYRNSPSPFAVFTRDGRPKILAGKNAAYLALSDCQVRALDETSFTFCSNKERIGNGPSHLTFEANSREERDFWLDTLKCSDMSKQTRICSQFLPTIEEYEDSEELQTSHRISHKTNLISV